MQYEVWGGILEQKKDINGNTSEIWLKSGIEFIALDQW